jgi:hypothetical protein
MKLRISFIFLLAITSCFFFTNRTSADVKQQSPKGITLSPALVQATVQSTESEHQIVFQITNNEQAQQNIKISTADFNTLDESGGLVFVGTNPTHLQKNMVLQSGSPFQTHLYLLSRVKLRKFQPRLLTSLPYHPAGIMER